MNTEKLENEVKDRIFEFIPEANFSQIFFSDVTEHGLEGTYIYENEGKYKTAYVEKGKIRTQGEYTDIDDVLWVVLDIVAFHIALDYASKNREAGKDFRRALFKKEIELYSKFGRKFENRKLEEINNILKNNPYVDK